MLWEGLASEDASVGVGIKPPLTQPLKLKLPCSFQKPGLENRMPALLELQASTGTVVLLLCVGFLLRAKKRVASAHLKRGPESLETPSASTWEVLIFHAEACGEADDGQLSRALCVTPSRYLWTLTRVPSCKV